MELLEAGLPPGKLHWIELTFAVVLVNRIWDPAQIVSILFTAGGVVLNVADCEKPSRAVSNEKQRKTLLKNLIRMCIRRYAKKGSFPKFLFMN